MDVIGHDHPRVQFVVPNLGPIPDRSQDELCDGGLPEKGGAAPGVIEQAVHRDEGLTGGQIRGRKGALWRKTAVQAEGDEHRLADGIIEMREPPSFQYHVWIVREGLRDSPGLSGLRGRRRRGPAPRLRRRQADVHFLQPDRAALVV